MTPTEILKHEHEVILLVIAGAEREGEAAARGAMNLDNVEQMADFFRNFVDRCHHAKEEKQLFPAAEKRGIPRDGGPIGVMLSEHDAGRDCVRAVLDALPAARAGKADAVRRVGRALLVYAELLRGHIFKEDNILYPMCDRVLTAHDQAALLAAFDQIESEEMGEGVHEKYHELAHRLGGG